MRRGDERFFILRSRRRRCRAVILGFSRVSKAAAVCTTLEDASETSIELFDPELSRSMDVLVSRALLIISSTQSLFSCFVKLLFLLIISSTQSLFSWLVKLLSLLIIPSTQSLFSWLAKLLFLLIFSSS